MKTLADVYDRLIQLRDLKRKLADESRRADQGGLADIQNADGDQFAVMASIVFGVCEELGML